MQYGMQQDFGEKRMIDLTDPTTLLQIPTFSDFLSGSAPPNQVMVMFEDGSAWTRQEALDAALRTAGMLRGQGVGTGDRVGIMLANRKEFLEIWWGAALLGAVIVPLNNALRGRMLEHVIETAAPSLLFVEDDFRPRFDILNLAPAIKLASPDLVVAYRGVSLAGDEVVRLSNRETHALIFTSGTSGPSKASVASFAQIFSVSNWLVEAASFTSDDRFLIDLPMCHLAALSCMLSVLSVGGSIALRTAPAMSRYWEVAAETQATTAVMVGTMAEFLLNRPPSERDTAHQLCTLLSAPLPNRIKEFRERFGIKGFVTSYGSTEANIPLTLPMLADPPAGTCGKVRPGFEVRLVDEHDVPVPDGEIGEAIVRCSTPWVMSMGYFGDPTATAHAWRNGWFHTGDLLRRDKNGFHFYHDRSKDSLRRRGENISSFEVERDVMSHPSVAEAACVAVPYESSGGDDEVKVFIVPAAGVEFDFEVLHRYLSDRMPHFMVPRFYEIVDEFSKTPSARIRKFELRERGNSATTWDSEAAGLKVTRKGLTTQ
jgi:crotonobetaine/carnitine-CoA ligase